MLACGCICFVEKGPPEADDRAMAASEVLLIPATSLLP
jgi:hypothetical protein